MQTPENDLFGREAGPPSEQPRRFAAHGAILDHVVERLNVARWRPAGISPGEESCCSIQNPNRFLLAHDAAKSGGARLHARSRA